MAKEAVDHPSHYQSGSGLEVIDVIKAFTSDLNGVEAFDIGNVIKYVLRFKNKNGVEDLKKAQWYLEHCIQHMSNGGIGVETATIYVKKPIHN